ncbi:hypothetical protein AKJ52_01840 [candidate division MSBL1 archaeon SCGC-AAA382C18]|uniref:6-pyruvoyl tetrahydropterin synthase n=1 Tax=candidate division MSBL1 archaeon SCGC-AAA382C18 TaxID=1698281 RepID=A0A133VJP3_9EURY|nr:hypothetical protein AKJ52_01840 [candidate division MSBL1 archaeon SCGC-AAA382C18]
MHTIGLKKQCKAKHFLPDQKGKENDIHSHKYTIEVIFSGEKINKKGYLLDINELNKILEKIFEKFENNILNELPEFRNINPTLENFSKILWRLIGKELETENISTLKVKIHESEDAYASYGGKLQD